MKLCGKCKLEKEDSQFSKDKRTKDGLCYQCKECDNKRNKERYANNIDHCRALGREKAKRNKETRKVQNKRWYEREKESILERGRDRYWANREEIREGYRKRLKTPEAREKCNERNKKWRQENKELHNAKMRLRRKTHKLQMDAVQKVADAVRRGNIVKPTHCENCLEEKPLQGHHDDYKKPLEVRWLCVKCHNKVHGKLQDVI